tara:strand:+ start:627 stop:854 length:228 start_codon:yes stop_codon:yes gene_type:complete
MLTQLVTNYLCRKAYAGTYNLVLANQAKKYLTKVREHHGDKIADHGTRVWNTTKSFEALERAVNMAIAQKGHRPS